MAAGSLFQDFVPHVQLLKVETLNHQSLLSIENLHVSYRAVEVLDVPSLSLGLGAVGLLGVNGAGKTTLLSALAGIHRPRSGRVLVSGFDPYHHAERRRALKRVALVPQEFDFPRHMRLSDFLIYMAELRDVPRTRRRDVAMDCAERVDLAPHWGSRLSELSGGMLRRASIAQALAGEGKVLLCDESTAGLDPQQRMEIRQLIMKLAADHCVLFASHIVEDLAVVADRVLVLDQGKVVFDGSRADLEARAPQDGAGAALERAFLAIVGHRA